jgi:hypothetical protein
MDEGQAPSRSGSLRIGLTGPIGCGKSTVAGWLGGRAGVVVIDADQVAREVVEPGEPALDAVIARFGPELRRDDGSLDRAGLGRIVFADPEALRDLEAIVHPAVRPRILEAVMAAEKAGAPAIITLGAGPTEGRLADACGQGVARHLRSGRSASAPRRSRDGGGRDRPARQRAGRLRRAVSRTRPGSSTRPAIRRARAPRWTAPSTTHSARPAPARRCEARSAPPEPERPFCSFGDW